MVLLVKNGGVISKIAIVSLMVALPLVAQQQGLVVSQPEAAPAEQPAAEPQPEAAPAEQPAAEPQPEAAPAEQPAAVSQPEAAPAEHPRTPDRAASAGGFCFYCK